MSITTVVMLLLGVIMCVSNRWYGKKRTSHDHRVKELVKKRQRRRKERNGNVAQIEDKGQEDPDVMADETKKDK